MNRLILILSLAALACIAPVTGQIAAQTQPPAPTATRYIATATRQIGPTATRLVAVVTAAESLHVRTLPGEKETVIDYLYHGETVTLTGTCRAGWAEIELEYTTAWVNAKYLSGNSCRTN
jgi:uncharacterized protein YgiM (DUF1202 family)